LINKYRKLDILLLIDSRYTVTLPKIYPRRLRYFILRFTNLDDFRQLKAMYLKEKILILSFFT